VEAGSVIRAHARQGALLGGGVACLLLAAVLGLLALDVARWRGELASGDVRYRAFPGDARLWHPPAHAPLDAAERLLGIDDDLAYRNAVRSVRIGRLEDPTVSDPRIAILRTDASVRLESVALSDPHPERRSDASNLLGVLSVVAFNAQGAGGGGAPDRSELLLNAIASFRQAIELDPDNADAKFNLETILQRGAGLLPTEAAGGRQPSPGGRGSRGAGAGEPGSGY
jgi:hypothetical protein